MLRKILTLTILTTMLSGCGTSKKNAVSPTDPTEPAVADARMGFANASAAMTPVEVRLAMRETLDAYSPEWEQLKVPVTLRLQKPKNMSISGTLEMVRNKSLMLSLRYFGFEVGSLWVTADTITVVDRMHKSYLSEPVADLLNGFPATLSNLQDLLTGRIFELGHEQIDASDIDSKQLDINDEGGWSWIPPSTVAGVDYGFGFGSSGLLEAMIAAVNGGNPVTVLYGSPRSTAFGPMASPQIQAKAGKTDIDATIDLNLDKAKWDADVSLRQISIPSGYKKISRQEIAAMLSKI